MNQETRDAVREGAKRSASIILPIIFDTLGVPNPKPMLDVGCGEGWWCIEAEKLGARAVGVDVDVRAPEDWDVTMPWDAEALMPLPMCGIEDDQRWPLALCLETAEHLTPAAGDHLVAEICRVSDAVVWSAAIPGQGGDGHINEQWPSYWAERFSEHDWFLGDAFRETLWMTPGVEPWYRQNLLLAIPPNHPFINERDLLLPHPMIDPVTWAHHRGVPGPGA